MQANPREPAANPLPEDSQPSLLRPEGVSAANEAPVLACCRWRSVREAVFARGWAVI